MIVALAGGVGASKFLRGLVQIVPPEDITVIVNTGDDIELHGLHISPDIDTVIYTLAGTADPDRGWGLENESWHALGAMGRYNMPTWFQLGDHDLATHLYRTTRLATGIGLATVTAEIATAWGVTSTVLPMTEDRVVNRVVINAEGGHTEDVHFQEYFVKRHAPATVVRSYLAGIESARPLPAALEALANASSIVLCPSNPIVSIGPILALPGVSGMIRTRQVPCVAVSPIIGDGPVAGPADRLMRPAGIDVSCVGIAKAYSGLADTLVIDTEDADRACEVAVHMDCVVTDTLMTDVGIARRLAEIVIEHVAGG